MKYKKILFFVLVIFILMILAIFFNYKYQIVNIKDEINKTNNEVIFEYEYKGSTDENMNILVKISNNDVGIDKLETPDGNIINSNGRNIMAVDYKMSQGNEYRFKVTLINGEEYEETVNVNKPETPVIEVLNDGYMIATESGFEVPKVRINFKDADKFNNYYSLDSGNTWIKYDGEMPLYQNIIAKSENKIVKDLMSTSSLKTIKTITNEAIDENVDNSFVMSTYPSANQTMFMIDDSIWKRPMKISATCVFSSSNGQGVYLKFLDENDLIIGSATFLGNPNVGTTTINVDKEIIIPENAKKAQIYYGTHQGPIYIKALELLDKPIITYTLNYPKLTANGYVYNANAKLDYWRKDAELEYKIEDGEWTKYTDDGILVDVGKTIYAKGKDKTDEKDISILKIENGLSDIIPPQSFDDNLAVKGVMNCYPASKSYYVKIDDSAIGKKLDFDLYNVYFSGNGYGKYTTISFVNENKTEIQRIASLNNNGQAYKGTDIQIPSGTKYLQITIHSYGGSVTVNKISIH